MPLMHVAQCIIVYKSVKLNNCTDQYCSALSDHQSVHANELILAAQQVLKMPNGLYVLLLFQALTALSHLPLSLGQLCKLLKVCACMQL